ncbi:Endonuclease/exonuclease/phosphatase [Ephemerocybe angulata]|uniref:Endonuclease/exonuclease/phosphatase n=1 Tax=Ephemerocybe angulata TaxID=980116 RepID=A0A8H6LTT6_9AGAR|nr:Endonuclease/exonuclease/phosphatase [Tulosesus angulatus]
MDFFDIDFSLTPGLLSSSVRPCPDDALNDNDNDSDNDLAYSSDVTDALSETSDSNSVHSGGNHDGSEVEYAGTEDIDTLRIASWNINGDLAVDIRSPAFINSITSNSITFFQETGLAPSNDISGHIPNGYEIVSLARPVVITDDRQWGGVAAVYESNLALTHRADLSHPDIIVLELEDLFVVNTYIPPPRSHWWKWSHVHPEVRLTEVLAACSGEAGGNKGFIVTGDFNGRTGHWQLDGMSDRFPRLSSDSFINTRGRWIRDSVCTPHDLIILNGTSIESTSPGSPTSFQAQGAHTVIDYALVSQDIATQISSLSVTRPDTEFDHALLEVVVEVSLPIHSRSSAADNGEKPTFTREECLPPSTTDLDHLLDDVMASAMTDEEACLDFYGPAAEHGAGANIYISCHGVANGRFRCAIARSPESIEVITVSGPRQNALLSAIAYVALHAPLTQALIFTSTQTPSFALSVITLALRISKGISMNLRRWQGWLISW